jgi:hypothetical protein
MAGNPAASGLIYIQIFVFRGNPLKYTDPDGKFTITLPLVVKALEFVIPAILAILSTKALNDTKKQLERNPGNSIVGAQGPLGDSPLLDTKPKGLTVTEYIPPPKDIPGIPGAKWAKPKTPVQGGGGLRRRWKDKRGNIYEWDYQEGHVEKYNPRGKHQGAFDPNTGEQKKPADPKRGVEP